MNKLKLHYFSHPPTLTFNQYYFLFQYKVLFPLTLFNKAKVQK